MTKDLSLCFFSREVRLRVRQPRVRKLKTPSFSSFPIGSEVTFSSGHAHANSSGTVISYEVLRLFPYLGEVPRVRLKNGTECFATKPQDFKQQDFKPLPLD
jgi:hypothetical protein